MRLRLKEETNEKSIKNLKSIMKLLLTSAGIMNKSIEKALLDLIGKPAKDIKVAFVPTAANITPRKKNGLIKDLNRFDKIFPYIDIVDFTAIEKNQWEARLKDADIIVLGGGNPFYLLYAIEKKGFKESLLKYLDKKVIVGISAGSMVMGKFLAIEPKEESRQYLLNKKQTGLNLVDLSLIPHLGAIGNKDYTKEMAENQSKKFDTTIYALDDNSTIVIDGDKMKVVSEGKWEKFK